MLSHFVISCNSLLNLNCKERISLCERNMLVSSANKIHFKTLETLDISFMYKRNKRGPSIDPRGTPHLIF